MVGTYTTYPNITDINFSNSSVSTLFNFGNTLTGGVAAPGFLLMIAIVSFMALATQPRVGRAFAGSSFVTLIVSILMMGAGLLDPFWFMASLAYVVVSLYMSMKESPY